MGSLDAALGGCGGRWGCPCCGAATGTLPGLWQQEESTGQGEMEGEKWVGLGDFHMSCRCESLVKVQSRHRGDVVLKWLLAVHLKLNVCFHGA